MKKLLSFMLAMTLMVCACGCYDYRETEKSYIVSSVGFDQTERGVLVCLETANSSAKRLLFAEGADLNIAYKNLSKQFSKTVDFSHTACVVLGEKLNKKTQQQALEFCRDADRFSLSAHVIKTVDVKAFLSNEPTGITVGFDVLEILKRSKSEGSVFYKLSESVEIMMPYFILTAEGITLLESRREYIG